MMKFYALRIIRKISAKFNILVLFAFLVILNNISNGQTKEKKRNVLFIAVDDMKPLLGCYGDKKAVTPNIDRLAQSGFVFLNNHCQQAVCAPTRASLLTSMRPDNTKVWDLKTKMRDVVPEILTMPEYFRNNGYETAATGKIYDFREVDKGHDVRSWSIPYIKESAKGAKEAAAKIAVQASELPDSAFIDTEICENGLGLLEQLSKGAKPFFVAVGIHKPHLPFIVPKKYWELYDRNSFEVHPFQEHSKNAPDFAFQPGWEIRNYDDIVKEGPIPIEKQKELIHGYYACVTYVDALVGKLLDKLDKLGLTDNTTIIIWGDHGWHLGDHGMWCKHSNFEQATRSPLIISSPFINKKGKINTVTEFLDVFPTLCEINKIDPPKHLEGKSLAALMNGKIESVKEYAVSQFHRDAPSGKVEGYSFRDNRYRYVVWLPIDIRDNHDYDESKVIARELYDYEKDPMEMLSVFDEPEYKDVVLKMKKYAAEYFNSFKSKK